VRTRPLSELSARDLRPLLDEESDHWQGELLWDYRDVSSAVANGLDRGALTGFVAQDGPRALAYCYYMLDGMRAIVGSLYAAGGARGQGLEEMLLDSVLAEAQRHPGNDRVECQTLFSTAPSADGRFARAGFLSCGRHYLVRGLHQPVPEPEPLAGGVRLRPLKREDIGLAARVVHQSHEGSLDAALNLTYATPGQCRSFVETLVLRAGCGRFAARASFVAEGPQGSVGVLLASHLSRANGHVCQVSVLPEAQGRGIGGALMAAALGAFREEGLEAASLSVTVGNEPAYGLYRRLGFRLRKPFAAHAWVRPPAQIQLPA
jgi:ribosomal protein S18 acetylase RimI-like enzyme